MESSSTSAVLLCSDPESSRIVEHAFHQFGITPRVCLTSWAVQKALKEKDYDMLVLDFDEPEAGQALEAWTTRGPNSSKVVVAFASNFRVLSLEDRKHTHFYMQKPLTQSLLVKTLKVACGVVLKKRRAAYRCTVNLKAQASVTLAGGRSQTSQTVELLDISQGGSCIKANGVLQRGSDIVLNFRLPETDELISATGKVVWGQRTGAAGVQFTQVPNRQLHQLGAWLDERDPNAIKVTMVNNPNEIRKESSATQLRY